MTPAEDSILELSGRVIALRDSNEFEPALELLRKAIHLHLSGTREKVADLAFLSKRERL